MSNELLNELETEEQGDTELEELGDAPETLAEDADFNEELLDSDSQLEEPPAEADSPSPDPLEDALAEFDQQMMDDIPTFGEADDTLAEPEPESLDTTNDAQDSELADVPGLDDWLSTEDSDDTDNTGDEALRPENIYDELDSEDFDELLESLEADTPSVEPELDAEQGGNLDNNTVSEEENNQAPVARSETDKSPEEEASLQLDNPDLDLAALLNDVEPVGDEAAPRTPLKNFST